MLSYLSTWKTWVTRPAQMWFILISNTDAKASAATSLHLTPSPPIHTHAPLLDPAEAVAGMLLTMAGITLCVISSIGDDGPREVTHWQIIATKGSNPFVWLLCKSRNGPKRHWSSTKERIFDSAGGSLKSNGTWWENYPDSVWCREKGWSWNFKRQVEKEVGSGGVHVKGYVRFMTILNVRVEGDWEELWHSYRS